ncbi:MAG: glycosyltransferase family 1 protein, partial [Actinobacteria bacterium]|nr:glycosyltransferase family 1 protein [Actinomycetota bacterium]
MRVLTVIDSLAVGGAEQSLRLLTPHLVAGGVDMHVAYLVERPGVAEALAASGAVLHSVAGGGGRPGGLVRLVRLLRDLRPDVVHTTLYEADILGRTAAS